MNVRATGHTVCEGDGRLALGESAWKGVGSAAALRFARLVVRFRIAIVVGWVAVAIAAVALLPDVEQAHSGTLGDLVPSNAPAIETEARSVDLFSLPVLSRTVVVERSRSGFTPAQVAMIYARGLELATGRLPGLQSIAFGLSVTDDVLSGGLRPNAHAALTYLFYPTSLGPVGRTGLARLFAQRYASGPGIENGVTGAVPARGEQIKSITDALPLVELVTLLLITFAVGFHFRSVLAPLLNVVTVGLAYLVSVRVIGGLGTAIGIAVPQEVEPVLVALLFGIVTDYLIFLFSRFRRALADGLDVEQAATRTAASMLPIIATAALSVAAACASLVVAELGFYRAFGPGLALAVLITVPVVLTFVPALLALVGKWLFWPRGVEANGGREERHGRLERLRASVVAAPLRKPLLAVALSALPLLALTAFTLKLSLANTLISGLPTDSPPKVAYRLAGQAFPAGAISPTMVLVEEPGIASQSRHLQRLRGLLGERRNVAIAVGPGTVPQDIDLGTTVSPTGDAVRYLLVFNLDPLGARAINTVERLQADLPSLLRSAGMPGARASLAGDTALSAQTVEDTTADLGRILPAVTFVVFCVLAIFLRALVAPLYLVLASLLGLGAALGLTVLVFQSLLGYGELTFYVPFAGIVLLIALGSDYNVYLVGRVWAEAERRPIREAVAVAAARATSAITVAGLVLALSFAALAIVPLRPFRELAFLLSAGLLIDAFVVRSLLAPGLIAAVGDRSAWPGRFVRRVRGEP